MAYRDDMDALFHRATTLQSELDSLKGKLEARDRELEQLRGKKPKREDTSPGMRALRTAEPLDELMRRLAEGGPAPDDRRMTERREPQNPSPISAYLGVDMDAPTVRTGMRPPAVPAVPAVPATAHARIVAGLARVQPRHLESLSAIVDALGGDLVRESFVAAFETAALVARGR